MYISVSHSFFVIFVIYACMYICMDGWMNGFIYTKRDKISCAKKESNTLQVNLTPRPLQYISPTGSLVLKWDIAKYTVIFFSQGPWKMDISSVTSGGLGLVWRFIYVHIFVWRLMKKWRSFDRMVRSLLLYLYREIWLNMSEIIHPKNIIKFNLQGSKW